MNPADWPGGVKSIEDSDILYMHQTVQMRYRDPVERNDGAIIGSKFVNLLTQSEGDADAALDKLFKELQK